MSLITEEKKNRDENKRWLQQNIFKIKSFNDIFIFIVFLHHYILKYIFFFFLIANMESMSFIK
jgi:hypothetical protein